MGEFVASFVFCVSRIVNGGSQIGNILAGSLSDRTASGWKLLRLKTFSWNRLRMKVPLFGKDLRHIKSNNIWLDSVKLEQPSVGKS